MIPMPTAGTAELLREVASFNTKVAAAVTKLGKVKDEDVQIATTPKDEVFKTDKVTLYRYRPLAEPKIQTPVLIVYSLIGRYPMTDLQEDRSLIRNLLKQGVDVWVVDWGNSSRADRYLTIDDYVLGYLDDCVEAMRGETGAEAVDLLGICEGGVFTLALAALEPAKVKNLVLTITPLDFHADRCEAKLEHIPPPTVRVLGGKLGTEDFTELGLPGGHIGVFVSGKSQGIVGKGIVDWLGQRDR